MRDVNHAILPPSTTRPNPVVSGNKVFVAIFAPGAVCCLAKRTGELLWQTCLNSYAGSAVIFADGILFATSCRTLYALDPETGEIRWEFTPHSQPGEWIYSQPAVCAGRVFVGDRCGDFHCLDTTTGKALWGRRTSRARNNQVNATALIAGSRVVTVNNDGAVACYATRTGQTIWRQLVDGACTGEVLRMGNRAVVGASSLYALDLSTGAVRLEIGFPDKTVTSVTIAQRRLVAALGPDFQVVDQQRPWKYELVVIERGREIARRSLKGISALRTCTDTGLVYRVGSSSMDIIDPSTGTLVMSHRKRMALPDRSQGFLYGLTDEGLVFAERGPEVG